MTRRLSSPRLAVLLTASTFTLLPITSAAGQGTPSPWAEVAQVLKTPEVATGGYHRYNFPRRDITLRLGDVTVSPMLALGGWAGFSGEANDATLMGDLVVTAQELGPVLAGLSRQGIAVTSIHNHLAGESPAMSYIHFHADGEAVALARKFDQVVALTAAPRPVAAAAPAPVTIDTALVSRIMGTPPRASGNVAQLSFLLVRTPVTMHGRVLVPAMALGSPVNVQAVDASRAVATGDFAVAEAAVAPLMRALSDHGITATAMHSHLVGEEPRVYYIHFWGDGRLADVLTGLKAAVDAAR